MLKALATTLFLSIFISMPLKASSQIASPAGEIPYVVCDKEKSTQTAGPRIAAERLRIERQDCSKDDGFARQGSSAPSSTLCPAMKEAEGPLDLTGNSGSKSIPDDKLQMQPLSSGLRAGFPAEGLFMRWRKNYVNPTLCRMFGCNGSCASLGMGCTMNPRALDVFFDECCNLEASNQPKIN
ncbi:MAG TPA: hypothetical protein V6D17_10705 [Candidatus Obscuribacterales bacterium]